MLLFSNNATTLLANAIVAADVTLNVSTGSGSEFPTITEGSIFMVTVKNPATGALEHMKCTARSSDALTVTRAQEGTTAQDFPVNSIVSLRVTKETLESMFKGRRNRLINGKLDFWDYGTTFATPADGTYVANRWKVNRSGTPGTFSVSRQAVTPGAAGFDVEPAYLLRWDQTVAATAGAVLDLRQRIEDVRNFAGKTITLSFWARSNSGGTSLQVLTEQYFGTGGSPSTTVSATAQNVTLTNSLKKYQFKFTVPSISGKTLGTNGDHSFDVVFRFPAAATFQHEFTLFQCEESPIATPFEWQSIGQVRRDCDRYYWNTFPQGTAPAQNAGLTGSIVTMSPGAPAITIFNIYYPVPMRATPTVTTYNPSAANTNARNVTLGADGSTSSVIVGDRQASFYTSNGSDAVAHEYRVHVSASAEL